MNPIVGASLAREQNWPESANYWFQSLFASKIRDSLCPCLYREQGSLLQGNTECRS